ncbi:MAG: M23 family metallopeptidase [Cytophagales bacterium]|nr:MAG: M23 family metallopeptidase [Cytophagales bacterium]
MQKKTLSNLLTQRFLLIIREEENLAIKFTQGITYAKLLAIAFGIFCVTFVLSFFVAKFFYKSYSRLQPTSDNQVLLEMMMKLDSLSTEVEQKDRFILSFKQILAGGEGKPIVPKKEEKKKTSNSVNELDDISSIDSAFRRNFEGNESNNVRLTSEKFQNTFFFTPVNGVVTRKFDSKAKHYGIDIVSKKNEAIKAITDGSIIISSWTQDSGYVIGIQHKNQLISFYKHNSVLLKKVGDYVKAGDIVAIIGDSGELTDGPHLHFELWHNGNPTNPEDFISF